MNPESEAALIDSVDAMVETLYDIKAQLSRIAKALEKKGGVKDE